MYSSGTLGERKALTAAIPLQREVYYPESDGKPMGETEIHRDEIYGLIWALQQHYRHVPDVHVTGDLLFYYVQGDPRSGR